MGSCLLVSAVDGSVLRTTTAQVATTLGLTPEHIEWSLATFGEAFNNNHIVLTPDRASAYRCNDTSTTTFH